MMDSKTCLSAKTLTQLTTGELAPATVREIEAHVDDCNRCRELLDSESDPRWRHEIWPVLRTRELEAFEPVDGFDEEHELHSSSSVLQLLGPTDDPHMLGRIGSYEIASVVGQGGMGIVFKAFDATLNRFVAIKMLLPHLAASGAARKRFAREGRAAAAVIDDNVMPIYSVDQWQGTPYLVTQYSSGSTLQRRIQEQGPMEAKEILRIALQTARGLQAAHAQGLVHRDVKPSNILLDGTVERAMLTDFGLARAVDDASITRTGTISGTPQYMSPEQARGGNVDARSDLFGLGCVMYAMCTGRPPFRADNSYAILRLIAEENPRPIQEINPDIPAWLGSIISKMMAKRADNRFADAGEVAELLEACLAHIQQPAKFDLPKTMAETQRVKRFSSFGNRSMMAGLAFLLLAAGAFGLNELNHGKLIIECSADDVPIRISQGDTVVEAMTVMKKGATVRIAAGNYRVEVDGDHREFSIENNSVVLSRGGTESVKITLEEQTADPAIKAVRGLRESGQAPSQPTLAIAPVSALLDPRVSVMGNGPVSPLQVKSVQVTGSTPDTATITRSDFDGLELGCRILLRRRVTGGYGEVFGGARIIQLSEDEAVGKLVDFPMRGVSEASSLSAYDLDESPFEEKYGNGRLLVDLRLNKSNGDTVFKSRELVKRLLEIGGDNIRVSVWPQAIRSTFAVLENSDSSRRSATRLAIMKYLREQDEIELSESSSFRILSDKAGYQIVELDSANEIEVHPAYPSNDQSVSHFGWRSVQWTNSGDESKGLDIDLSKQPLLGMADIVSAELVHTDGSLHGNYAVEIKLNPDAAKRFGQRTKNLIEDNATVHLAVFTNESFSFAAHLVSPIRNRSIVIAGRFNDREATDLITDFEEIECSRKRGQRVDQIQDDLGVNFDTPEEADPLSAKRPQPFAEERKLTEVFQRYSRMVEQRNWKEMLHCWTDDCRDDMIQELMLGAELASIHPKPIDEQKANELFLSSGQFLKELKEQFPALDSIQPNPEADDEGLGKRLTSLDPDVRRQARISLVRNAEGLDHDKLLISLIDLFSRLDGSDFNGQQTTTLVDVDVRDDEGSAIVVSSDASKRTPVTFKKTAMGWKIDRLGDSSLVDQLTAMNRQAEAINLMLFDSNVEAFRNGGVSEEEIEALREELTALTRPPAKETDETLTEEPSESSR